MKTLVAEDCLMRHWPFAVVGVLVLWAMPTNSQSGHLVGDSCPIRTMNKE
jgi:hypothetical protein